MKTTIRTGTDADIPAVLDLAEVWAAEGISFGHVAIEEAELRAAMGPYFLVAEREDDLVGFALAYVRPAREPCILPDDGEYLSVDELYVRADCRGDGIGSRFIAMLTERAREAGLVAVLTFTDAKDQQRMQRFFEDRGFRAWGIQLFRQL